MAFPITIDYAAPARLDLVASIALYVNTDYALQVHAQDSETVPGDIDMTGILDIEAYLKERPDDADADAVAALSGWGWDTQDEGKFWFTFPRDSLEAEHAGSLYFSLRVYDGAYWLPFYWGAAELREMSLIAPTTP